MGRPWRLALVLAMVTATLLVGRAAAAMEFTLVPLPGGQTLLRAHGVVMPDDFRRFVRYVDTMDKIRRLRVFEIDSPGGFLDAAERIAVTVHNAGIPVAVPEKGTCASACVIIFAAAPQRAAGKTARIGVHRASVLDRNLNQRESDRTAGYTEGMALHFEIYGVPRRIIDKMNETAATGVSWLDSRDLASMAVVPYRAPDVAAKKSKG